MNADNDVVSTYRAFTGLSPAEARYLDRWERAARAVGIDTVEDLIQRPWPCAIHGAVIGIFVEGDHAASWLVVKHNGFWAVACCADGTVSTPVESLAAALSQLYVPGVSSAAPS
jgi:hypothetical protein